MSYTWAGLTLWTFRVSIKSPWWPVWTFCAQNLLKATLLHSKICVLLKVELFSRNSSPWLLLHVNICHQKLLRMRILFTYFSRSLAFKFSFKQKTLIYKQPPEIQPSTGTLAQVLSCKFRKICKSTFFTEHFQVTACLFFKAAKS